MAQLIIVLAFLFSTNAFAAGVCSSSLDCGNGLTATCSVGADEQYNNQVQNECFIYAGEPYRCRAEATCTRVSATMHRCASQIWRLSNNTYIKEITHATLCCKSGQAIATSNASDCN